MDRYVDVIRDGDSVRVFLNPAHASVANDREARRLIERAYPQPDAEDC